MSWTDHIFTRTRPTDRNKLIRWIRYWCRLGCLVAESETDLLEGYGLIQDKDGSIVFVADFRIKEKWNCYILEPSLLQGSGQGIAVIYIKDCPPLLASLGLAFQDIEYVEIEARKDGSPETH